MKVISLIFAACLLVSCESKQEKAKMELHTLYCNIERTKKSVEKYPKSIDIIKMNTDALDKFKEKSDFYQKELGEEAFRKVFIEVTTNMPCK